MLKSELAITGNGSLGNSGLVWLLTTKLAELEACSRKALWNALADYFLESGWSGACYLVLQAGASYRYLMSEVMAGLLSSSWDGSRVQRHRMMQTSCGII